MNRVTALVPAALLATLAACAPAGTDHRGGETTPTTEPVPASCTVVADKADTLVTMTSHLTAGNATVNQVRSAATDLVTTFDNATATTAQGRQPADRAVRRVEEAVTTHPVDTRTLHDATGDLLTALDDGPNLCAS